jgi:hypothetical protein
LHFFAGWGFGYQPEFARVSGLLFIASTTFSPIKKEIRTRLCFLVGKKFNS